MKRILITGSSKGLGKYLVTKYSKNNIIHCCSRRDPFSIEKNITHHQLDISNEEEVIDMARFIENIDVLINNAGIASMNHFMLTPYEVIKNIFETNVYGTFLLTREVLKKMIRQKSGRIINISTIAVPMKLEGECIYSSSKAAVEQMTKVLAKEVGEYGITVNTVAPSVMKTNLTKTVPKQKLDKIINQQAIKRYCTFEDVKNVIDFFINDKSGFVTGQTIYLGGM